MFNGLLHAVSVRTVAVSTNLDELNRSLFARGGLIQCHYHPASVVSNEQADESVLGLVI